MTNLMDKSWKELLRIYERNRDALKQAKRELWNAQLLIGLIKKHREEFSPSQPVEWIQELDRIFRVCDKQ